MRRREVSYVVNHPTASHIRQTSRRRRNLFGHGRVVINLLVPDWRPTPLQALWAIRIGIVLSFLVAVGHLYHVTVWDWISLLIVPSVIAGGSLWFNSQQRAREQQIADYRAQDEALQAYLDQISQLLIDEKRPLHRASPGDNLTTEARARTLTVLPSSTVVVKHVLCSSCMKLG